MSPVESDMELLGILKMLWLYHGLALCWKQEDWKQPPKFPTRE